MGERIILVSGAVAVKKFRKVGWRIDRVKGSHIMLVKENHLWTLSIPQHDELGIGILSKLIKQSGITVEEFNQL